MNFSQYNVNYSYAIFNTIVYKSCVYTVDVVYEGLACYTSKANVEYKILIQIHKFIEINTKVLR